ncbi:unnamed protein product [Brassica rapa subsp. trilocularis]
MHIDEIPVDLIIEILLRLPTKSIARCRCVSKLWGSILRHQRAKLFMTRSQARPQILFSFRKRDFFFFLTPQVQNKSGPVRGFVCLTNYRIGMKETVSATVIYNLSTGQAIHLPNVKTSSDSVKSYLGFDPTDKQFKVLLITSTPGVSDEHQVLTLGTPNHSWRNVKCCCISYCYPHSNDGICINGGFYYVAAGKLGAFVGDGPGVGGVVTGQTTSFVLWVLVDAEKHEWSKHLYVLPPLWKNVVAKSELYFVGVTGEDEIVFSTLYISDPFYVYYYNIESNTVTRVEIQGMSAFKDFIVHASLDHVEDVKLMQYV